MSESDSAVESKTASKKGQVGFSPPEWLREVLIKEARDQDRSVSNVVTRILTKHFKQV